LIESKHGQIRSLSVDGTFASLNRLRQNGITLYALHMWDLCPVYENQWRMVQLQGVIAETWLGL